jgi:transposase
MQTITTVGLDIAKSVFQVHCVDAQSNVVLRRQLKRRYVLAFFQKLPSCLVGIEACASSHYWSRELQALGHTVRTVGRSEQHVMQSRSIRRSGQPTRATASSNARN